MQIRVKCSCGESCAEWAIVELQGVVEAQPAVADHLQNLEIGVLCRPSAQEVYTFTVGYHELTGNKVPLKKPMLVLKKMKHSKEGGIGVNSPKVELDVVGIIRQKILFKTRPKALISISITVKKKQSIVMQAQIKKRTPIFCEGKTHCDKFIKVNGTGKTCGFDDCTKILLQKKPAR